MRFGCGCFLLECKTQGTEFDKEALQNNFKEIPLGYELAEIDSDMNLIMNMLLTKLTVKQTLLEDRDKQLGIWREWTIYFWVNYDDTTNITLNLLKTDF